MSETMEPQPTLQAKAMSMKLNALKGIVLVALLIITLVCSMLPFIVRRAVDTGRRLWVVAFGLISCFGGGVFLSTALLDLLPDSHDKIHQSLHILNIPGKFPLSEFLVAIGFFLVLFIEQIVLHFKETGQNADSIDREPLSGPSSSNSTSHAQGRHAKRRTDTLESITSSVEGPAARTIVDGEDGMYDSFLEPQIGRTSGSDLLTDAYPAIDAPYVSGGDLPDVHLDPSSHSTLRAVLLVSALSLHACFEGLAVGLQDDVSKTLQIFAALCLHKSVIAFSLGIRLVQSSLSHCAIFLCCLTFSGMATLGGLVGLACYDFIQPTYSDLVGGCLQAVACGTFLYVVSFEILPHELNESGRRLWKLLMLILGFALIAIFVYLSP